MGLFDHLYNLDWTARYTLEYYYNDGRHSVFDKYEIDMFGGIYNKKTKIRLSYRNKGKYDETSVFDSTGKRYVILVSRAVVSTFHGKPPTKEHSTEHIDCTNKNNDIVCELTWIDPSGQAKNRVFSKNLLTAYIIVCDSIEMTAKEWVKYSKTKNSPNEKKYTYKMILQYAQKKKHGFSYKVYEDLPGEKWYKVVNSENKMGRWEISDQNRIAYVSKFSRNVIDATRFGFDDKYPRITINNKLRKIHDVAFEAYYPDLYTAKLPTEMILHKFDDKLDFRPHMLYIGNASMNGKDAHDNGCHDGKKSSRISCCSYINGVFEKRHDSLDSAASYLRSKGYPSATYRNIGKALRSRKVSNRYGRTWKNI